MFETESNPIQIREIWEARFGKLVGTQRQQFLNHPVTRDLCKFEPRIIEFVIFQGRKRYLKDIKLFAEERLAWESERFKPQSSKKYKCSYCGQAQDGIYCLCVAA